MIGQGLPSVALLGALVLIWILLATIKDTRPRRHPEAVANGQYKRSEEKLS